MSLFMKYPFSQEKINNYSKTTLNKNNPFLHVTNEINAVAEGYAFYVDEYIVNCVR